MKTYACIYNVDKRELHIEGHAIALITDGTYPAYENAINTEYKNYQSESACSIFFGISAYYLSLLQKCLLLTKTSSAIIAYPQGPNKGVMFERIYPSDEVNVRALIMPCTIPR